MKYFEYNFGKLEILSKEDFNLYMKLMKDGDMNARDKIINGNIKLIFNLINKYYSNSNYDRDELFSIGVVGLIKAVDTYDINKNYEFSTYASRCICNEILMFFRKKKKYMNDISINDVISLGKNDEEISLEGTIKDEKFNMFDDIIKVELIGEIRRLVDSLNIRDREIVKLYFGFDSGKRYNQEEIADKVGLSKSYICRIIRKCLSDIAYNLYINGYIDDYDVELKKMKGSMVMKNRSIYEYFSEFSRESVDKVLLSLNEVDMNLLKKKFGDNLDGNTEYKLDKKESSRFYSNLVVMMKKRMGQDDSVRSNQSDSVNINKIDESVKKTCKLVYDKLDNSKVECEDTDGFSRDDFIKMLEVFKGINFDEMLKVLSVKDAVIISLMFGYVEGKYFSSKMIASFLEIDEFYVIDVSKKVLLLYKEKINYMIDMFISDDNRQLRLKK